MVNGFMVESRPERNANRKAKNEAYLEDEKAAATLKEMLRLVTGVSTDAIVLQQAPPQ